jgi:hypothetical protein
MVRDCSGPLELYVEYNSFSMSQTLEKYSRFVYENLEYKQAASRYSFVILQMF